MGKRFAFVAAALVLGWAGHGAAQERETTAAPCPATPAALQPALAGWAEHRPIRAAADAKGLAAATVEVGRGVDVTLLPTSQVRYPVQPEKPGGSVSHGGLVALTIPTAGTYRVALGAGAWIDVIGAGKPVASTAHGRGPACTGVMKIVDFPLKPGRYVLQVSANAGETLSLLIAVAG